MFNNRVKNRVEIRTTTEEITPTDRNIHSKTEVRVITEDPKFILNDKKSKKFMIMKPKKYSRNVE